MIARSAMLFALVLSLVAACGGGATPPPAAPPSGDPAAKSEPTAPGDPPSGESGGATKTLADLQQDFMTGCQAKVPNADAYCGCGWEQMTKTFTEDELKSSAGDKVKLAVFKDRVEKQCKPLLPMMTEGVIKGGYLKGCVGDQPRREPYCECAWTTFRKTFSLSEMSDESIIKSARFSSVKKVAVKACGPKMPEDMVRDIFVDACSKQDGALKPFCSCAWKSVRGMASPAEVEAGLLDQEKAQPVIVKACGKLRPGG